MSPLPPQALAHRFAGPGMLFMGALLWGTNPAAMRYLFLSSHPPSPALVSSAQTLGAALLLFGVVFALRARGRTRGSAPSAGSLPDAMASPAEGVAGGASDGSSGAVGPGVRLAAGAALATSGRLEGHRAGTPAPQPPLDSPAMAAAVPTEAAALALPALPPALAARAAAAVRRALNLTTDDLRWAALEIGFLGFAANAMTVVGFQSATASRGAFLCRLSVVFTAVLAAAAGDRLSRAVWLGALTACVGGVLISADSSAAAQAGGTLSTGDALIVSGALIWALWTVRLGRHAPRFPALDLTAWQMLVMGVFSLGWLGLDLVEASRRALPAEWLWGGYGDPIAWAMLLYPAVGPWGLGTLLQVKGQVDVPASQTQIIYSTCPLWTLGFAALLGSGEVQLGILGWAGAALLFAATFVSARSERAA